MAYEKLVSADDLTWPHAYCGDVKLHPNDDTIQLYLDSDVPLTSEPNGEGIVLILVAYKSKSMTAHFRRKDAISSEYLNMVRKNIHGRMIDVVSQYIKQHGEIALKSVCKADVSGFKYDACFVEQNMVVGDIAYRPDIVVYQKDIYFPRIELEVVFTHDIERDRSEALSKSGHLLLSINIERWVNDLAQQDIEDVSENEILGFVKAKKFSYYSKKEKQQAERIWNEMRVIDTAEKYLDKCKFILSDLYELQYHFDELKYIVSLDYSHSITEKAVSLIGKIEPHLFDLREMVKENERRWLERLERERQEYEERLERERQEHEERKAMLEMERVEKEKLTIQERKQKEREKKERMDQDARNQEEKRNKREMKLASLKQKYFACR